MGKRRQERRSTRVENETTRTKRRQRRAMMMMSSSRAATTAAILVLVSLALLKNAVAQGAPSTPPTNPPFQIEVVDVPVSAVKVCKNRARLAFDIRVREIRSERNADIKEQRACEQLR